MKRVITRSGEKKESERQAESKRKRGGKERWRRNVNAECKQDVKTVKKMKGKKRENTRKEQIHEESKKKRHTRKKNDRRMGLKKRETNARQEMESEKKKKKKEKDEGEAVE